MFCCGLLKFAQLSYYRGGEARSGRGRVGGRAGAQGELAGLMVGLLASERL